MYALDTNTLIYFFKAEGGVADKLLSSPPAEVAVPSIVVFELETGIAKSTDPEKRRGQFDEFLRHARVLDFDRNAANHASAIRAVLEEQGRPIGPLDTLIAGTALAHGATLITRNLGEFSRVPGLAVENWYKDPSR